MAGVKGRSGGARPNSGGARPGAGRKPKPKPDPVVIEQPEGVDMLKLLQDVALGKLDATPLQVRAAIAAVQYTHNRKGDNGKREAQAERSKRAARKFVASAPPRLIVNNK